MSDTKKAKGLLITTEVLGNVADDGSVDVSDVRSEVEPVEVEYLDGSAGEVVYDAGDGATKPSVGYTRAYAAGWNRIFGNDAKDALPN